MKAIIQIELEMDGQWKPSDREKLIDEIQRNSPSMWIIEEDRLAILAKSQICRIVRSSKPKNRAFIVEAKKLKN